MGRAALAPSPATAGAVQSRLQPPHWLPAPAAARVIELVPSWGQLRASGRHQYNLQAHTSLLAATGPSQLHPPPAQQQSANSSHAAARAALLMLLTSVVGWLCA